MKKALLWFFILFAWMLLSDLTTFSVSKEMGIKFEQEIQQTMNLIYSNQDECAFSLIKCLQKDQEKRLIGQFLKTWFYGWVLFNQKNNPAKVELIEENLEKSAKVTISLARERQDFPPLSHLFVGTAYGYLALKETAKGNRTKAYFIAKVAKDYFARCLAEEHKLYDAFLGLGLYDYFVSQEKVKGIHEIKRCVEYGTLFGKEAKLYLAEIYLNYEDSKEEALKYYTEFQKDYPHNPYFGLRKIDALSSLGRWEEAVREMESLMPLLMKTNNSVLISEAEYKYGFLRYKVGNYHGAIDVFQNIINCPEINGWVCVLSNLYLAKSYYKINCKDKALKHIVIVLNEKYNPEFHNMARKVRQQILGEGKNLKAKTEKDTYMRLFQKRQPLGLADSVLLVDAG